MRRGSSNKTELQQTTVLQSQAELLVHARVAARQSICVGKGAPFSESAEIAESREVEEMHTGTKPSRTRKPAL